MRIVGYTYQADVWCPDCIVNELGPLDEAAEKRGIDAMDEHSYDSGDFPKVIFSAMIEDDEYCCQCNEVL
jgi:hypothetical protein